MPSDRPLWSSSSASGGDHDWLDDERSEAPTRTHVRDEAGAGTDGDTDGRPSGDEPTAEAPGPRAGDADRRPPIAPVPAGTTGGGRQRWALPVLAAVALLGVGTSVGLLLGDRDGGAGVRTVAAPSISAKAPAETRLNQIYAATQAGVVNIRTTEGEGTGFVYNTDGVIVTNDHVVEGAGSGGVKVSFGDGDSPKTVNGRVLGTDASSDLAAVKVDPSQVPTLAPLKLAESNDVRTGDSVMAIGYPLGLQKTATAGIVSGIGRSIPALNRFSIDKVIQTDAPINPGNSGGPLLNSNGQVIGVNSQIATSGQNTGSIGIGFSIPSDLVRATIPLLARGEKIQHPYLGASLGNAPNGGGAQVGSLVPGAPGARAGLQAGTTATNGQITGGDTIVAIDGDKVATSSGAIALLNKYKPGQTVTLTVRRDGGTRGIKVKLGDRPNTPTRSSSGGGSGGQGGLTIPGIP